MIDKGLIQQFEALYGAKPELLSTAPGRVNIIGEHTDYNQGFVMPSALQFSTNVYCSRRTDMNIHACSLQYPQQKEVFSLEAPIVRGEHQWGDYVRGVVNEFLAAGHTLQGLNILITSDVPQGAGLSSSAALEVAVGGMLNQMFDLKLSNTQIAKLGQAAENNFVDCQCGIMDQLISAEATAQHAVLIDCENLATQNVHIPESLALVVINSNYPRKLVDSEYNLRRKACEKAAATMAVSSLRYADMDMLDSVRADMDEVTYRRARHIITENKRVLAAAQALKTNDLPTLFQIMREAHASLKNDFEITVPATDGLVAICNQALGDRGVARQTGGGFGGAVICLCDIADVAAVKAAVDEHYHAKFTLAADVYVCKASDGLRLTPLS
jgi:galactokinase